MPKYTATTADLFAPSSGEVRARITATVAGTVSFDEWDDDAQAYDEPVPELIFTVETGQIVSLRPSGKYRLTITGGTAVAVQLDNLNKGRL